MSQIALSALSTNRILSGLPEPEISRLARHLEFVTNRPGDILYSSGDMLDYVYFPQRAVISLLVALQDGETVEAGMIGREGAVGAELVLGAQRVNTVAVVHAPDGLMRISRDAFLSEFPRGSALWEGMLHFVRSLLLQAGQIAACNRVHRLEQRLCRWLLSVHDRSVADEIPVTHEVLSHVLGTPRSEVTLAAGTLRKIAAVSYDRGKVVILDRQKLATVACECYGILADRAA
jgi:CRP-like cAMP-binding protein